MVIAEGLGGYSLSWYLKTLVREELWGGYVVCQISPPEEEERISVPDSRRGACALSTGGILPEYMARDVGPAIGTSLASHGSGGASLIWYKGEVQDPVKISNMTVRMEELWNFKGL